MKGRQKSAKAATTPKRPSARLSDEELAAMKDRVREVKAGADRGDAEKEVLAKIAEMSDGDRIIAERLHAIITATPGLSPKTWYGMPAYAKDGKVVCFFQPAQKFKTRYATFGFSDQARLDEGNMWPNSYALMKLTSADESKIRALVKKAVG